MKMLVEKGNSYKVITQAGLHNIIPCGVPFKSGIMVCGLLVISEFIAQCSIDAVKDIWHQMRSTDYVIDSPLNLSGPSSAMLYANKRKIWNNEQNMTLSSFSRLFPPDYPKDGPNGRSPYLSSCKLHGGHHDQHEEHHHGKHDVHDGDGHLDSPPAPPSGSLPASPVAVFFVRLSIVQQSSASRHPSANFFFRLRVILPQG